MGSKYAALRSILKCHYRSIKSENEIVKRANFCKQKFEIVFDMFKTPKKLLLTPQSVAQFVFSFHWGNLWVTLQARTL